MLEQHGDFSVLEACDGTEALALLECHDVELVLSDLHMRPMDGHSLRDAIRQRPRLAHLPFIMMTAQHCPDSIGRAVGDQRGHYLAKPFSRDQLHALLNRALIRRAA